MRKQNTWLTAIIFFILLGVNIFPQEYTSAIEILEQKFQSFEYEEVIRISGEILADRRTMNDAEVIEIYRLRASSFYSLQQEEAAASSFEEILRFNSNYELDPVSNSPKIMEFFSNIKKKFLLSIKQETGTEIKVPEIKKEESINSNKASLPLSRDYRGAVTRSIILPGWGHLYEKSRLKGVAFGTAGLAGLGAMIYFIPECNKKEKEYLLETDRSVIASKYDEYNKVYKLRNASIAAFAVIWLYTQIDLLFISDGKPSSEGHIRMPEAETGTNGNLKISYRLYF